MQKQDFMLDTVVIKLRHPAFRVTDPNFFTPALAIPERGTGFSYQYGRHRYVKYVQNPTGEDKRSEIYKPNLTAYQRSEADGSVYDLHIKFSVPKLLFNQSVQEVDDSHFNRVVEKLHFRLGRMGIETTIDALRGAIVVEVHFGKNILLPEPITVLDAMSVLARADLGKGKRINVRHFDDNGEALYFFASSAQYVFYDKIRETLAAQRKSAEKDQFRPEKNMIKQVERNDLPEILRFEIRFTKQQSVDAFLSGVLERKVKGVTFEDIFKKDLCQKALLYAWNDIVGRPTNQLAFKHETPIDEIFQTIIKNQDWSKKKSAHTLNSALANLAYHLLIQECGVKKVRNRIEKNWTDRTWKRLSEKASVLAPHLKDIPEIEAIAIIQKALLKFERCDWSPPVIHSDI